MKNLKTQLAVLVLSALGLLTGAYAQLTPSQDAYTNTAAPTTNYGDSKLLDVESSQTTYIQFDLSVIPAGYTGSNITKASLKLYVNTVPKAGSFNVDYVNGTWSENTITANLAPALGTTIQASVPLTTADKNQYILVDITAAVQAWLSGTANDGIALVGNSPVNATFDSKESTTTSHPPELDIVFAGGGGSGITGINTASGSGLIGGGTSGTLNLSLTNTCAASQILQWSGSAWACASPGTGTITGVTAGTDLLGGGTSGNVTLSLNTSAINGLYAQLGAANTFTANQTVNGTLAATSSSTGVLGTTNSTASYGVEGSGPFIGVYGTTSTQGAIGVEGVSGATTDDGVGVEGFVQSPVATAVIGQNLSQTGPAYGVWGTTLSSSGTGVVGYAIADGFPTIANLSVPVGVMGASPNGPGVYGASAGVSEFTPSLGAGVWGDTGGSGNYVGVLGTGADDIAGSFANNGGNAPTITAANYTSTAGGVVFYADMPGLLANDAAAIIGDPGCGEDSGNMGLQLGQTKMSGCANYTLLGNNVGSTYLNADSGQTVHLRVANADVVKVSTGAVSITGTLSATGTKNFRIDHPLDPGNKYLTHAAVESSEVLNLYSGNATLDDSGAAVVQLPDWFEAINKDFRYQLTNIGGFAPVYIAEEVSGGRFKIAGGKPGAKVSWQVTGVRNDAWEKAYPMVVEADKGADRGHYLTPELYGQPATERIGYEGVPPENEQIVRHRRPTVLRGTASPARTMPLPAPPKVLMPRVVPLRHAAAQVHQPDANQK